MTRRAELPRRPGCDFCPADAAYDGRTRLGPWAYMCGRCFHRHGLGLGLGHGQVLAVQGRLIETEFLAANLGGGSE